MLSGLAALAVSGAAAAQAAHVGATHALVKVRPSDTAPTETSVAIDAAQNEFEENSKSERLSTA